MRTSIVIPIFNGEAFLRQCVASLANTGWDDRDELILVDNASSDGVPAYLDEIESDRCPFASQIGSITIIRNSENRNFAGACNQGLGAARGKWICFLNSDITAHDGWLDALHHDAERYEARVVEHGCYIPTVQFNMPELPLSRPYFRVTYIGSSAVTIPGLARALSARS